MLNAFCWYLSLDSFTAKTKGNFQPDRVTSVAASMPNNVHTSTSVNCLISTGSRQLSWVTYSGQQCNWSAAACIV